jgi:hypothetical protein
MKNIGILSVLALVLVGFGYFTLFATPANETASNAAKEQAAFSVESEQAEVVQKIEPRKGVGSLDSLRLLNENLECKISYTPSEESSVIEGTYFVSKGNMRGDFLIPSPDLSGQVLSSMIIEGTTMYVWSEIEGETYGVKMPLSLLSDNSIETNEPVALDVDVAFDCVEWEYVDTTVFIPPSDTLFQDTSSLLGSGMEYGTLYEQQGEF